MDADSAFDAFAVTVQVRQGYGERFPVSLF